uniref:Ring finger protein 150 n=1 Tax=Echinococcus granulosus TaxID=6210 RepID=A0A068WFE4_ECHGR|nr:ring finger protein 150 [Echinococcus granulosus]
MDPVHRKLNAATRKALKQLPVKCLNQVDPLISEGFDQCAICIEVFKPQDLIRSLPCRCTISPGRSQTHRNSKVGRQAEAEVMKCEAVGA